MKKVLLLLVAIFCVSGSLFAQKIVTDDVTTIAGRQVRIVTASSETFRNFTDKVVMSLCLMASKPEDGNDAQYTLCVNLRSGSPISAPASARILIRTADDETIAIEESGNVEKSDIDGKLELVGSTTVKTFEIDLLYNLTDEQLASLCKGIKKIRIETNGEKPYEKEWKKDKIGKFLTKEYELLKGALSGGQSKRVSFDEDF